MGRIGTAELIIILVVLLLLFGAKRIPEIARSIGRSLTQFKKGLKDGETGMDGNSGDTDRNEGDT
ncbi:MAG TPA: twin-arginine translocase TatA/TatE family subunit [Candidatus Sabulitectum sp.]|jgi:sec-independent protein translocase protein TatA|nr:twin-arginine translocase TatA/TatE family subunit [Candidatus Sabulitectum sp.]HPF31911.1 twin-arginine translocase TatA/TatE family subunit [Candidatus Sabulitectum sp.]HPJ27724.1 twin-arginine translocase TatA/TatE family subunit [Candidatus Sabulitectum sp.]HPR22354.1 twin-arginine translocase TatA/TatE family subunit [Candidatus Sabulitectum sp.]HRW77766.1 twin-arginine translocase TatA/TatE family subunit [Candidatus Sabulitectum sp.]